jgi:hypothetical protein
LECGGKRERHAALAYVEETVSWKSVADGSESAVDAGALPAQSKMVVGMREPGVFWSAAGSESGIEPLAAIYRVE